MPFPEEVEVLPAADVESEGASKVRDLMLRIWAGRGC